MKAWMEKIFGPSYRKFVGMLIGVAVVFFQDSLWLSEDQIEKIVIVIGAFLGAQGLADFGKGKALVQDSKPQG